MKKAIYFVITGSYFEVIDHHRVVDIRTMSPLYFRAEPVGCTCTIIAKCIKKIILFLVERRD